MQCPSGGFANPASINFMVSVPRSILDTAARAAVSGHGHGTRRLPGALAPQGVALGACHSSRTGEWYLLGHLLEFKVERRAAARYALGYERLQVSGQDAGVEQTVAHEVHELGELRVGELERRLEQRVETCQNWLDRAEWPLQVWRQITRRVMAR